MEVRTNHGNKTRGISASILRIERGSSQQLFLAHCFHVYKKNHVLALNNYTLWPSGSVYSKATDMSPEGGTVSHKTVS